MHKSAQRLVGLDQKASGLGLYAGQSLSEARALCPGLVARPLNRAETEAGFAQLTDWHTRVSPLVSIHDAVHPFGDMMLDITGVAHLSGGEEALLEHTLARLQAEHFEARGAIATDIGAAWALSHYTSGGVLSKGGAQKALRDLPVAALRIGPEIAYGLEQMGLKTIGQLYGRNRAGLKARFSGELLFRLDQGLGQLSEKITARFLAPEYMTERRFGEPVSLSDQVLSTIAGLGVALCAVLEKAGLGAQTFHLYLYRTDHQLMHFAVNANTATRNAAHIARLFAHRLERASASLDSGFGIDMIRLAATSCAPVNPAQPDMEGGTDAALDLGALYDRLVARLGPEAALGSKFVDTHIPEQAVRLEPVQPGELKTEPAVPAPPEPVLPRPLRLLPRPEQITVLAEIPEGPPVRMCWRRMDYIFTRASGPERIGVEWWQSGTEALTRDYYVTEDEAGRRFWLFREGLYGLETISPRWFMHGLFA
ncbi:MAG: DNA polymerase Y family protein [Alphaproteobacteria bacterium]|nr:DNA polymerase Y family protein [Alphaproteobacteria bacterium]